MISSTSLGCDVSIFIVKMNAGFVIAATTPTTTTTTTTTTIATTTMSYRRSEDRAHEFDGKPS